MSKVASTEIPDLTDAEADRLFDHLDMNSSPQGCWLYDRPRYDGYGYISIRGKLKRVHRVLWTYEYGREPAQGMDLDHTCHNVDTTCPGGVACQHRRCANPAHLEEVTHAENVRRGRANDWQRAKVTCPRHHMLTGGNLRASELARGRRSCRACDSARRKYEREFGKQVMTERAREVITRAYADQYYADYELE